MNKHLLEDLVELNQDNDMKEEIMQTGQFNTSINPKELKTLQDRLGNEYERYYNMAATEDISSISLNC